MNTSTQPPYAVRDPHKEWMYTTRSSDFSRLVPDSVSAAVEGYFRFPAIWVGEPPQDEQAKFLNPTIHHAIVYRKSLSCNIKVCAQRDGTFLFDFSQWPLAPLIIIPGYDIPAPPLSHSSGN